MDNERIKKLCEEIFPTAVQIRRAIHSNPELGRREKDTTGLIISYLNEWGVVFSTPLETGVVACVKGKNEGPVVALRADIDALPMTEQVESEFKSRNEGVMHACGHDFHTAALLCATKVINDCKDELCGEVRFIFQPDEEGDGGAERLCEKGVMNGVDEVYGIHVTPEFSAGTVGVKYGKSYAASDIIEIDVIGKGGHGAQPHKNVDAIVVAAHIITALQSIVSRNVDPIDSAVLTIGTVRGGIFRNTVAERCEMTGVLRSLGSEMRQFLKKKVTLTAEGIAESLGAKAQVRIIESYPGVVNDEEKTDYVKRCAEEILGRENVKVLPVPGMVTEDFGYYLQRVPGCFYHVGCDSEHVLHSDRFCPDERALKTMIMMHIKTVFSDGNRKNDKNYDFLLQVGDSQFM